METIMETNYGNINFVNIVMETNYGTLMNMDHVYRLYRWFTYK